jgi:hypothetical protein
MKPICAVLFLSLSVFGSDPARAKDSCTFAWAKGHFKSYKEVEHELRGWLTNAKILRLSLCGSGNDHYFLATILEAAGKVHVVRLPAR